VLWFTGGVDKLLFRAGPSEAKRRGMKTILWTEDVWRNDIPGIEKLQELDMHGRPRRRLCMNNPYHRNFLLGLFAGAA